MENLFLCIAEAMSASVPVVATNISAVPEIIIESLTLHGGQEEPRLMASEF